MNEPAEIELVAILRGLTPERAPAVGAALFGAGSASSKCRSILRIRLNHHTLAQARLDCLIGAGTVLTVGDVNRTHAAGGRLIVSPNCDPSVVRRSLELGMRVLPGIATPTEAFVAMPRRHRPKLSPPRPRHPVLRALSAVLPNTCDFSRWAASARGHRRGSRQAPPDSDLAVNYSSPEYTAEDETRAGALQALKR